jgi:hypothetical protein
MTMTRGVLRRLHDLLHLMIVAVVVAGCGLFGPGDRLGFSSGTVSCQPVGYSPAPIPLSFAAGPVSSSAAEATATYYVQQCAAPMVIAKVTATSKAAVGLPSGPNAGQTVWLVQVDGMEGDGSSGGTYAVHFLIEVNESSGAPTLIGLG